MEEEEEREMHLVRACVRCAVGARHAHNLSIHPHFHPHLISIHPLFFFFFFFFSFPFPFPLLQVAIKKVLQDRRFKNRELAIMRTVRHTNIVALKHCFHTAAPRGEVYLHLVLEFVPDTVYRVAKAYAKSGQRLPSLLVKLYAYQALRSLAHLHACGICHRDVKPQNLLVDTASHVLKLCDFGSAKALVRGEPNISYICSRYYRAPELIFGATDYTPAIDVWSAGCVAAELMLGAPLFPGESGVDQLVEIIKVLGTPSRAEIGAMNPNYTDFKFPQIRAHPWAKVFSKRMPPDGVDLVARLLVYDPAARLGALDALAHPFFDELRCPGTTLPSGAPLPPLTDWRPGELDAASPEARRVLEGVLVAGGGDCAGGSGSGSGGG